MPSGMLLFLWSSLTIGGTFCASIFNFLGVPLKPLYILGVPFGLLLPLDEVLSIGSFGPRFEVMFWLKLCVTLLLQKSD